MPFTVLTFVAVVAGGLIQIIPTVVAQQAANVEDRRQIPYTPLELAGRDLYVSDGCYLCHSQMIRTLVPDVLRYGDYSRLGESIYDHPFQWGSKRNGPDLARVGGKYPNIWHLRHLEDPRSISAGLQHAELPVAADRHPRPVHPPEEDRRPAHARGARIPDDGATRDASRSARAQAAGIADDLRAAGARIAPGPGGHRPDRLPAAARQVRARDQPVAGHGSRLAD